MHKKLKIAFFGDDFARKGKGTALVIRKIAEEIVKNYSDIEVTLLRPEGKCDSPIASKVRHVIIPRRFSTLLSYIKFFFTHRDRYDAVVFNRFVYPFFWLLRSKKFILFVYDASRSEVFTVQSGSVNTIFESFLKYVGRHFIDAAIAVSDDARMWIGRHYGFPLEKVITVYPGAGNEYYQMVDDERETWRGKLQQKYNMPSKYILAVSRFDPHKNIEGVIRPFFSLKERGIPHALVLVGGPHTPRYSENILKQISASKFKNEVHIVSYVESKDLPAVYNCADALLYPSLVEGFGLPVVEAMKCGTPVVTSSVSSMPEIAGDSAVLVDPMSSEKIAEGIRLILDDVPLRERMVQRGLVRAAEFSWEKTVDEFVGLLKQ